MLNKGVKSEEDRRIESIVVKLSSIGFVPDDLKVKEEIDAELAKIGLTFSILLEMEATALNQQLLQFNFGWDRMEQFADVMAQWAKKEERFKAKAKSLYSFIQNESKAFSFEIMAKIGQL
ncbi:hypothetical protein H4K35_13160 [Myroides sp. NP-2]|uniref:hypothetical protein n=1 Tax=Myroides sp. NP-2 TaxID=2759945 RepID=UPI0015FD04A1|nr:hypothetical protein [Myroides sp. NP-2]MBB1151049.1 hypothetical protein [Myroides sp. NP-2]